MTFSLNVLTGRDLIRELLLMVDYKYGFAITLLLLVGSNNCVDTNNPQRYSLKGVFKQIKSNSSSDLYVHVLVRSVREKMGKN